MEKKQIYHPRRVFDICLNIAKTSQKQDPPSTRGRGRPPLYEESLYFSLLLFRSYFRLTFRETIAFYKDLFPGNQCPSFQALHRFLKKKASLDKIEALFSRLNEILLPLLPPEEPLLILELIKSLSG